MYFSGFRKSTANWCLIRGVVRTIPPRGKFYGIVITFFFVADRQMIVGSLGPDKGPSFVKINSHEVEGHLSKICPEFQVSTNRFFDGFQTDRVIFAVENDVGCDDGRDISCSC